MKLIIAQIVQLLVSFIKSWYDKYKLKKLTTDLNKQKETYEKSKETSFHDYNKFIADYDKWTASESAGVQRFTPEVPQASGKPAADNKRTGSSGGKAGRTNSRTNKPNKRRKSKRFER